MKNFKIKEEDMKPITPLPGSCIASDRITVDGMKVGYMYREETEDYRDSGWRFFAGDEDRSYLDNADNFGIFSLNTICNYDSSILPYLEHKALVAFEKVNNEFKLVK